MDFDPDRSTNEALWIAGNPTKARVVRGDVHITIPFQKQMPGNEMVPDMGTPTEDATLIIRCYSNNVMRLFIGFGEHTMYERSHILIQDASRKKVQLSVEYEDGGWLVMGLKGRTYAAIDPLAKPVTQSSQLYPPPQHLPDIILYPDEDKAVMLSSFDHFSPMRYDALPLAYVVKNGRKERATISFECEHNECFAGTGERFAKMDLSGRTFRLKNQDAQGVNNRRAYKNVPFYISSRMYGTFYHTSACGKLSLADHSSRSVQFMSDQPLLDVFLIGGKDPEAILKSYRGLTGYPAMPPLWSFGVWMSRMSYMNAVEIESVCRKLRRDHYPCDVIHLDRNWSATDNVCEWVFDKKRFPNPTGFIKRLRKNGFRVSLRQLPYISKITEQTGETTVNIDFTHPLAVASYKSLLKRLFQMGVACVKADSGENIHPGAHYREMRPELLENIYPLLYQKATYEETLSTTGQGIIWSRAGWAGCQRFPIHWGGEAASTWDGMAASLRGALHLGLSGFAFWSHDVPGYHSLPDFMNSPVEEELYMRWTQFGVFSSHFRYHGTSQREPWHYASVSDDVRRWWKLRYMLLPYIVNQSIKACVSGHTMVRAMIFHHPTDRTCWHIDDQYYFGDTFLVAPIMNYSNTRDVYLPRGKWVNFFTGENYDGGRWLRDVTVPLDEMPVYVLVDAEIDFYPEPVRCTDEMNLSRAIRVSIYSDFKGIFKELNM